MTIQKTHFADDDTLKRIAELEDDLAAAREMERTAIAQWQWRDQRIAELEAERDALKADAERYRWLRVNGYLALPELMDADDILHVTHKLDDAIDAAKGE